MTGFGRGEYTDEKRSVTCEIRSVNHRFCEINVKMLKARIKEKISRGKIELSVMCDDLSMDTQSIRLNVDAAQAYFDSLNQLKQQIPGIVGEIDIHFIANMPEVLKVVPETEDEDAILASLLSALDQALVNYDKMRTAEGENRV